MGLKNNEKGSAYVLAMMLLFVTMIIIASGLVLVKNGFAHQQQSDGDVRARSISQSGAIVLKRIQQQLVADQVSYTMNDLDTLASQVSSKVVLYQNQKPSITTTTSGNQKTFWFNGLDQKRSKSLSIRVESNTSFPKLFFLVSVNSGKCADIATGSLANQANVWQWTCNGLGSQRFELIPTGDGHYEIKNTQSGKVFTVDNGGSADGTNIYQLTDSNLNYQQFKLERLRDNIYFIKARHSGKCVDVNAYGMGDGFNIYQWTCHGGANQQWLLLNAEPNDVSTGLYVGGTLKYESPSGFFYPKVYTIRDVNSGKCVDVKNSGTANFTNVWLFTCNQTNAQNFMIFKTSDGFYQFRNLVNDMNVDVYLNGTVNGTNVNVYAPNDTGAQKFKLIPLGQNRFQIIHSTSNRCLDVAGGGTVDGTNIQIWDCLNVNNQKFEIREEYAYLSQVNPDEAYVSNGWYRLINPVSGKCLDGRYYDATITTCDSSTYQWFYIEHRGNGSYTLKNEIYQDVLSIEGSLLNDRLWSGKKVQYYYLDNQKDQYWKFHLQNGNQFSIQNRWSGKCMDVASPNSPYSFGNANGTLIYQVLCANSPNQRWVLQPKVVKGNRKAVGIYTFRNQKSNLCMEVVEGSMVSGGNIRQNTCNSKSHQLFHLKQSANEGLFKVISQQSQLIMDVQGVSKDDGANIYQWVDWNGPNQKWSIHVVTGGIVNLRSFNSDRCVDVQGAVTTPGGNIEQQGCVTGATNQQWRMVPFRYPMKYASIPDASSGAGGGLRWLDYEWQN